MISRLFLSSFICLTSACFEADVTNRLKGYVPIHLTICQTYKKGEVNLNIRTYILAIYLEPAMKEVVTKVTC